MKLKSICMAIVACVFCANMAHGEINDKKIWQLIGNYDVADTVRKATTPEEFWERLRLSNPRFAKTSRSLNGKGDKDLKESLAQVTGNAVEYFSNVPTVARTYDFSEQVADGLGARAIDPKFSVTVTSENDLAIFGYPNGYLFMTGALYDMLRDHTVDATLLLSAETAHYVLQHAYEHAKWEKSRSKKIRLARILVGTVVAAAEIAAETALQADNDYYYYCEPSAPIGSAIMSAPVEAKYLMEYSPEQIIEADIVAYRFTKMKYGSGKKYIDALRTYGYFMEADHPATDKDYFTVADRIKVLEVLDDLVFDPAADNITASNEIQE